MSATSFRAADLEERQAAKSRPALPLSGGKLIDLALLALSLTMLYLMWVEAGEETIPYHILFLSLTVVYGFRVWPMWPTLGVIVLTTLSTGWIMFRHYQLGAIDEPELAEIFLMPALVVAMVWHARRRDAAQRQMLVMADERRATFEREREFFRDTSHAIRTPVTIARGHLELASQEIVVPSARNDVRVALRQLDRMSLLSNRLLALAQLDAGFALRPEPIRIRAWIAELCANWSGSADREWVVDCPFEAVVRADPEWLALAVDAVVENAVRFTQDGGRIELAALVTLDECRIRVTDDGPGIAVEDLPHVFERFWHRSTPNGQMGSGLGLPMTLATMRASGGTARAWNDRGGGAVFELALPRLTVR
jgi:signal transduction histidine kinase